jgi:hypothetical protein
MPAIWTLPKTWAVGEIVTAEALNTHLRDNLDYLKLRDETALPAAAAGDAAALSTTSPTFTDMSAALRLTLVTSGAPVLLGLCGTLTHSTAGAEACFTLTLNGVNIGDSTYGVQMCSGPGPGLYAAFGWHTVRVLAAGTYQIAARWRTSTGTLGTLLATSLYAVELR